MGYVEYTGLNLKFRILWVFIVMAKYVYGFNELCRGIMVFWGMGLNKVKFRKSNNSGWWWYTGVVVNWGGTLKMQAINVNYQLFRISNTNIGKYNITNEKGKFETRKSLSKFIRRSIFNHETSFSNVQHQFFRLYICWEWSYGRIWKLKLSNKPHASSLVVIPSVKLGKSTFEYFHIKSDALFGV